MNFEGPKITSIFEKDSNCLKEFLKGKKREILKAMIDEPYNISKIISEELKNNPESYTLNSVSMYSDKEISKAAQKELNKRSSEDFLAM